MLKRRIIRLLLENGIDVPLPLKQAPPVRLIRHSIADASMPVYNFWTWLPWRTLTNSAMFVPRPKYRCNHSKRRCTGTSKIKTLTSQENARVPVPSSFEQHMSLLMVMCWQLAIFEDWLILSKYFLILLRCLYHSAAEAREATQHDPKALFSGWNRAATQLKSITWPVWTSLVWNFCTSSIKKRSISFIRHSGPRLPVMENLQFLNDTREWHCDYLNHCTSTPPASLVRPF